MLKLGRSKVDGAVHHIDGDYTNNVSSNVDVAHGSCHNKHHSRDIDTSYTRTPEARAKMRAAQQRRVADPVERERRSRVASEVMRRPAQQERMRTDNPSQYLTPESRATVTRKITGKKRTAESRQRYSDAARKQWADPAQKEKRRAAIKAAWARRKSKEE